MRIKRIKQGDTDRENEGGREDEREGGGGRERKKEREHKIEVCV